MLISIDPGDAGGIALLRPWTAEIGEAIVSTRLLPLAEVCGHKMIDIPTLWDWCVTNGVSDDHTQNVAIVERAQAMPAQGVSSSFKYGRSYGQTLALVSMLSGTVHTIPPQRWKRLLDLSSDKNDALDRARKIFPQIADDFARKKDQHRAEAALMGYYYLAFGEDIV